MSKKIFKLSLVLAVLTILVSGCTLPWKKKVVEDTPGDVKVGETINEETATSTKQIKKFENYDELKAFLEENNSSDSQDGVMMRGFSESFSTKALAPTMAPMTNSLALESGSTASARTGSLDASVVNDYSTTNNQVAGVDEADIIKTDGNYIYALVRNELKIIKVNPAAESTVLSTITFKSRPQDIFISGSNLAVFGADQQIYAMEMYQSFRRQNPYTFFKVFDLTNPSDPKLVRDLNFEGSYTDARLIGDYAYLFTNSSANYIESEPLLPRVLDKGVVLSNACDQFEKCFAPDVYYFDIPYDSYNFANVTAINIKDNNEAINGQAYLMNYGQNLYVSPANIYITYTEYLNEYDLEQTVKRELTFSKLSADDQDKIAKIEASANFILSKNEKKMKVAMIIDRYLNSLSEEAQKKLQDSINDSLKQKLIEQAKNMEKTVIHKIAINGKSVEYKGMGEVSGQVLNQFSMDENGDYFRIATTRNPMWSRLTDKPEDSYSNVYVLNNELKVVGSLENLATTERIYAARFMGDRLYLVTFKKTDPLYAIGLSDPTKPSVLGAIKLPGFSNYLHPADKNGNKIIGFGRDAEEEANGSVKIKGLKVALFDFTDLNKPKELDSYLIGDSGSDSIALQDHKAFLYSEAKNLLVLPAVLRENGRISFAGSLIFDTANNKFTFKGRIDHSEGGNFSESDYWRGYDYYNNTVKRSLYINDNLFTFSNKFLKINSLSDLSSVKSLTLTSGGSDYIITPTPLSGGASVSGSETPASSSVPLSGSSTPPELLVPPLPEDGSSTPGISSSTNP